MPPGMSRAFGFAVLAVVAWGFVVGALELGGGSFRSSAAVVYGFLIFMGTLVGAALVVGGTSRGRGGP